MIGTDLIQYILSRWIHRGKAKFPYGAVVARNAILEGGNKIGKGTFFSGKLGLCSYIGRESVIFGDIGRFTSIASNCTVLVGRHAYTYPYVSTSPAFYSLLQQTTIKFAKQQLFNEQKYADEERKVPVKIGNDCWINSDVRLVSGVTIADGAVILAGSIVTKDVPPFAIVGGVPAKIIKYRYKEEDIRFLMHIRWWERDLKWIQKHAEEFCDFQHFKIVNNENIGNNIRNI